MYRHGCRIPYLVIISLVILCLLPVQSFHPENDGHVDNFQCMLCNASYYCKNGERYACPTNSIAIQYADSSEECVCNPGYLVI
jgi:hypothetical protein